MNSICCICYVATAVDNRIAEQLLWKPGTNSRFTPDRVATLRSMYDSMNPDSPLDTSNIEEAAKKIAEFRAALNVANSNAIKSTGTYIGKSYRRLKNSFTSEELNNRINMVSNMISLLVDDIVKNNPNISRKNAIEGMVDSNGNKILGEFALFDEIYNQLLDAHTLFTDSGQTEKAQKLLQVLSNWSAISAFVRLKLRITEGVKLGNHVEYASEANESNFGDNNMADLFNLEESVREGWQEVNGMQSAFGSIGQQVRRLLGRIPIMEEYSEVGEDGAIYTKTRVKTDDLGFPVSLDSVKAHQALSDILRGVTNSTEMMMRLAPKGKVKEQWLAPVVDVLQKDPTLKTKFFVDMKRNFQPYSIRTDSVDASGNHTYKTKVLNRIADARSSSFLARINMGHPVDSETSVFDSKGNINVENMAKTFAAIADILGEEKTNEGTVFAQTKNYGAERKSKFYQNFTSIEKRQFLVNTLRSLGIDADADTIDSILKKGYDRFELTDILSELYTYGYEANKSNIESDKTTKYSDLFKATQNKKESVFKEKVRKINTLLTKHNEGLRLESRIRYKNSKGEIITMFSNVIPSYLGDFMDSISSYVEANDKAGLNTFLTEKYLSSSYFVKEVEVEENGVEVKKKVILNKWLEELLKSTQTPSNKTLKETFAAQFSYLRHLGTSDTPFENLTAKQHMIDMFVNFAADKELSPKATTALFPVFILGDSGVSKYIRANVYSKDQILDGLYNVYLQELNRWELVKAVDAKLAEGDKSRGIDSYDPIKNFSGTEGVYTTLSFLNSDFVASDGTKGKYSKILGSTPTEKSVKDAISKYMEDSIKSFKKEIDKLGLFEKSKDNKYSHFQKVSESNMDSYVDNFYWNLKFATIQQVQLMTIDSSFYKNIEDFQKRYKEIHAPGTILDVNARYFNGEKWVKYSETGIENCIYFKDLKIDASVHHKEFMETIERVHSDDPALVDKYRASSLTDGQGYRTLESYRKVMGMGGLWTEEMQAAYDKIMDIRQTYGYDKNGNHPEIPKEVLAELAELAVVFQPIKPYMFTHERLALNSSDVLLVPVQHKYSEAVLIPELLPNGSKLKDMAYWMSENDIDMIGSTEIVKVGNFGSTDISKATDATSLRDALSKAYIHQLSYNDYRIQNGVPEHMNASQLFGTQVRKLIMSGISMHKDYSHYVKSTDGTINLGGKTGKVTLTGDNLVKFYTSLHVANILDSFDRFSNNVSDTEKLSQQLIQNILNNSRESVDNILAFTLNENGDFTMPLFEGGLEYNSASLLLSLFKKMVNKQTIKGGSLVQASAMGIKDYSEDGGLQYIQDKDGNIVGAQCEVPFDLSYTDASGKEIELKFEDYCNEDGTLKTDKNGVALLDKDFPGMTDRVAYRIPTEKEYSMIKLKIVRFSRKMAGGTIKVPAHGTTISGFDFDIDKLYFMMKEFKVTDLTKEQIEKVWKEIYKENPQVKLALEKAREEFRTVSGKTTDLLSHLFTGNEEAQEALSTEEKDRLYKYWKEAGLESSPSEMFSKYLSEHPREYLNFETYDTNKTPLENTRVVRNNMLIDIISQRLMDSETLKARTTPGGFAESSIAAKAMRVLQFEDYSRVREFIKDGKIDFNAIMSYAASKEFSDPRPNYSYSDPMTMIIYNQQNQVAGKLIGIFANQNTNHAFSSTMKEFKLKAPLEFAGHSYGDGKMSDLLRAPNGVNVDINMAEYLAASVDAVKDPVLNYLNLNTVTADTGALLSRIGYTPSEIGLLFNQPIIKELCDYCMNNSVSVDIAARELGAKYKDTGVDVSKNRNRLSTNLTTPKLTSNILNARFADVSNNFSFIDGQMDVLSLFLEANAAASELSQFISSTKFTASNAVGSTFGDMYAQQMKVNKYYNKLAQGESSFDITVYDEYSGQMKDTWSPISTRSDALSMSNEEYMDYIMNNPFGYEQTMYDCNKRAIQVLSKYYPYETKAYSSTREMLRQISNQRSLDAKTINTIHNDIFTYLLSTQSTSEFNGNTIIHTEHGDISRFEYYTSYFSKDLFKFIANNPWVVESYDVFKYMTPAYNETTDELNMKMQDIGGLAPYMKDNIKESWVRLFKDPDTSRIAIDLFLYNFYNSGFEFNHLSFMNLAPVELKEALQVPRGDNTDRSYVEFLHDILNDKLNINPEVFARMFIMNHPDNTSFGIEAKSKTIRSIVSSLAFTNSTLNNSFTLDLTRIDSDHKGMASTFVIDQSKDTSLTRFVPTIKLTKGNTTFVYMAESFDVSKSLTMKYNLISQFSEGQTNRLNYQDGNTLEIPPSTGETFNLEASRDYIAREMEKAYERVGIVDEQGEKYTYKVLAEAMKHVSVDEVKSMVETLRKACRENGVVVVGEDGSTIKMC